MRAEDVGWKGQQIVLGKHSGRNAFISHIKSLGIDAEQQQLEAAFERFKQSADAGQPLTDQQIIQWFGRADEQSKGALNEPIAADISA